MAAEKKGYLTGARIDIPAVYDSETYPYRITAETSFDASIQWVEDIEDDGFGVDLVTTWRDLPSGLVESHGLNLDADDAIIYAQSGSLIAVIRNKDGSYQSRVGWPVSGSRAPGRQDRRRVEAGLQPERVSRAGRQGLRVERSRRGYRCT